MGKIQDKQAEIEFFDVIAEKEYDVVPEEIYSMILSRISLTTERGYILDAGCGTGAFGKRLARLGYQVIGVDISQNMVRQANTREKFDGFHAIAGDMENPGLFEKNTFDIILCGMVLHHFPNLDSSNLISNFRKWLRPQGTVVVFEPNGSNPLNKTSRLLGQIYLKFNPHSKHVSINESIHYSHAQYKKHFDSQGFRLVSSSSLTFHAKLSSTNPIDVPHLISTSRKLGFKITDILPFPMRGSALYMEFTGCPTNDCIPAKKEQLENIRG